MFLSAAVNVGEALNTALGGVADQVVGAMVGVVPVAGPVLAAGLVIGFGIKIFKKMSK